MVAEWRTSGPAVGYSGGAMSDRRGQGAGPERPSGNPGRGVSPARIFLIQQGTVSAEAIFVDEMLSRWLKAGDVKMVPLDRHPGWEGRFAD